DPPEMRDSVQAALDWLDREFHPAPNDGWILSPADHPLLVPDLFRRLVERWNPGDCAILVPEFEGKRGHPVFFRWTLAAEVARLRADQGLNALVRCHADDVVALPVTDPGILVDLDTPADYDRLRTDRQPLAALNPEREQV
ncbi:MAG: NTP transferase domain-containing protein, partial [Planctomycetota bacterium]|nr:NTP transferase domain-containing protein [Planctomycetota bacterium]